MASLFSMCGQSVRHLCSANGWPGTCFQPFAISLRRLAQYLLPSGEEVLLHFLALSRSEALNSDI